MAETAATSHYVLGHLAVVGDEKVHPGAQRLHVRHICFGEQDLEILGQLVEE